ncbi:hypothetical protein PRZ48_010824 [Zasmidium cellare]|uniref:SIMPL domain-containing protein n=1 Tax=Zasmidium cellare TaxID=395010 RepID=A0ABR0E9Q2_ZASCE|nr:hypothetical protein PRZ48_010824 [Zasmidium cellare]
MATDKFEITLRGEANVSLPAERAVLGIDVSATDVDKQTAFDAAVSTVKSVEALLRKLSPQNTSPESKLNAAVDNWTRTSLSETSQLPYDHHTGKSRPPRQYTSSVTFEARFQRFEAIAGVIQDLGAISNVKTEPLEWVLQAKTKDENRSALRVEAAKNAHQKALEYAQALGYQKVVPFQLSEGQTHARSGYSKAPIHDFDDDDDETSEQNMADGEEGGASVGGDKFRYQPENVKMSSAVSASFYAL